MHPRLVAAFISKIFILTLIIEGGDAPPMPPPPALFLLPLQAYQPLTKTKCVMKKIDMRIPSRHPTLAGVVVSFVRTQDSVFFFLCFLDPTVFCKEY